MGDTTARGLKLLLWISVLCKSTSLEHFNLEVKSPDSKHLFTITALSSTIPFRINLTILLINPKIS